MSDSSSDEDSGKNNKRIKSNYDIQRQQLEKLMENPDKEVVIPGLENKQDLRDGKPRAFFTHEFVRNVMGASAGAGSGEFDIYRGCRRRELIRQEYLTEQSEKEKIATEFEQKRLKNIKEAEMRTAKKRAKRIKQKMKLKNKNNNNNKNETSESDDEEEIAKKEDEEVIDLDEKNDQEQVKSSMNEIKN